MGWNYLSISKLQRQDRWSFGMDMWFHPTFYWAYGYLSALGLKLFQVNKRGPGTLHVIQEFIIAIRVICCNISRAHIRSCLTKRANEPGYLLNRYYLPVNIHHVRSVELFDVFTLTIVISDLTLYYLISGKLNSRPMPPYGSNRQMPITFHNTSQHNLRDVPSIENHNSCINSYINCKSEQELWSSC